MSSTLTRPTETESSLKSEALEVLQVAWKAIRRMETLSDDKSEAKAAERALAFVDKAFAELERKKR
jgi:hypothetical protein